MADEIYEIYPAIGIARVGNAPEAFYIGPEAAGGLPLDADGSGAPFGTGDFRDEEGRVKRQAARFRIFRSAPGQAPQEVTLDSAAIREIRWTVHLANKKASWYCFQTSRGQHGYACNHPLRNADRLTPAERRKLNIDPGPRRIAGRDRGPVEFSRSTVPADYAAACFPPTGLKPADIDTLGALKTDAAGRLLVLGGLGKSGTTAAEPKLANYANNDGWWDDTSDGLVRATILLDTGETVEAKPAWALVAPPAYAPQILNLVTLYDTVFDTAVRFLGARPDIHERGLWQVGAGGYRPRFDSEIRSIFERGAGFPWVSPIPAGPHSFEFAKLADPSPASADLRKFYLDILRGPGQDNVFDSPVSATGMMPLLVGDDTVGAEQDSGGFLGTSKYLRLTDTQYFFLQQWAAGHFEPGSTPSLDPGHALNRAVLENCVGGPLSPGIEMTWIARNPAIYSEPFRIRARPHSSGPLSLGFDPAGGLEPGDLTRYMALPWQADFNECAAQTVEGRVMWWWPAQRPITVFQPPAAGMDGLGPPIPWIGHDRDSKARDFYAFADHLEMLANWDKLGFVLDTGDPGNPRFVEVARLLARAASKTGMNRSMEAGEPIEAFRGAKLDAAIIGAGPAGAAVALALRRSGIEGVTMIDWPRSRRFSIGESAAPGIAVLLQRLGLDCRLERLGHRPCHGNLSFWGEAAPRAADYFSQASGPGWHLDRAAFDGWMREQACGAGARLLAPARLIEAKRDGQAWRLLLGTEAAAIELSARWVLDATGRGAAVSRRLGARLHRVDHLLALAVIGRPAEGARFRGFTMVEATETGWWYGARLPDGRAMLALMTDADIARRNSLRAAAAFRQAWSATIEMRRFAEPLSLAEGPAVFSAATQFLDRAAGPGWLALGDALMALDPLSASGLTGALEDALAAGEVIAGSLSEAGSERGLAAGYARRARATLESYLTARLAIYAAERRWCESPFWRRRIAGSGNFGYHARQLEEFAA